MEVPTYVVDMPLSQSQQPSSDLLSPDSSQINADVRYLIRGDALQVYPLTYMFRNLKEYDDMCVPNAAQVMPSGKGSGDILKQSTTPNHAPSVKSSNGDASMNTGVISRRSIHISTQT
jgi:hypothetical protein